MLILTKFCFTCYTFSVVLRKNDTSANGNKIIRHRTVTELLQYIYLLIKCTLQNSEINSVDKHFKGRLVEEARPQGLFVPLPGDVKGGSFSLFDVL